MALLLHILLQLGISLNRRELTGDEGITFLSITGHQGEYAQIVDWKQPPYGKWMPAAEWKNLSRPKSAVAEPKAHGEVAEFERIAWDLAHYDLHPPLYFWLAHIVVTRFGAGLPHVLGLNLLFDTFTILAVFLLGREVFRRERHAAMAALLWALSPGVLTAAVEARQYSILGLFSALLCWQIVRMTAPGRQFQPMQLIGLGLVCALGTLSHYQFSLVMAAGAFVLLYAFGKSERPRFLGSIAAMVVGVAVALVLVEPDWLISMQRQQEQLTPFSFGALGLRLLTVLGATGNFFVPGLVLRVVWAIALGIIFVAILVRKQPVPWLRNALWPDDPALRRAFVFGASLFVAQTLMYVSFRSHVSAMFQKYSTPIFPVMACMVVAMIHASPWPRRSIAITLSLLALGCTGLGVNTVLEARAIDASLPSVREADRIVFDNPRRIVLPTLLWHIPDQTLVFIAYPEDLLRTPTPWLEQLTEHSLWVNDSKQVTPDMTTRMTRLLAERFEPKQEHLHVFDYRPVYRLTRPDR